MFPSLFRCSITFVLGLVVCSVAHAWEQRLTAADVPCAAVIGIEEVIGHPQLVSRSVLQSVQTHQGEKVLVGAGFQMAHGSPTIDRAPARLGEHTEEVLRAFGFSADEIQTLRECAAIGVAA